MPRSLDDILSNADRLADLAEQYEPGPDDDTTTPEMLVRRAAWKRDQAERELAAAIVTSRCNDVSWRAIGEATGTSPQSAQRRYRYIVADVKAAKQKVIAKYGPARLATNPKRVSKGALTGRVTAKSGTRRAAKGAAKRTRPSSRTTV